MRKLGLIAITTAAIFLLCIQPAQAAQEVGLGIIFGEPSTGLSLKIWPARALAFDAALSWSSDEDTSYFRFHVDALAHIDLRIPPASGRLAFYYGVGVRYLQRGERFGLRVPLGLSYFISRIPLEFFVEIVPTLDLSPDTEFFAKVAGGLRVYLF